MIDATKAYAGLADIFADVFMRDDLQLTPDLSAKDVTGWDSFKHIEILMATEMRFRMKFTSAEVDSMRSVGDLAAIVAARGSA